MDILQQDRREAAEQRQELCDIITRVQSELQCAEEHRDKVNTFHHLIHNNTLYIVVFHFLKSSFKMYLLEKTVIHFSLSTIKMTFLPLNRGCRGCNGELCLQLESQCEQLQLKVRTLQLDWETEQKRSMSYFNQMMELEKERDQVSVCTSSEWSLDCHSSLVPNN